MKINISRHEVTVILNALKEQPYKDVAALIRKIVEQASTSKEE